MSMLFIFNNSQFEQILQTHAVSKKPLSLTKTKVKNLDPGNIEQNKCKYNLKLTKPLKGK